jgi:hypothetical protein
MSKIASHAASQGSAAAAAMEAGGDVGKEKAQAGVLLHHLH